MTRSTGVKAYQPRAVPAKQDDPGGWWVIQDDHTVHTPGKPWTGPILWTGPYASHEWAVKALGMHVRGSQPRISYYISQACELPTGTSGIPEIPGIPGEKESA